MSEFSEEFRLSEEEAAALPPETVEFMMRMVKAQSTVGALMDAKEDMKKMTGIEDRDLLNWSVEYVQGFLERLPQQMGMSVVSEETMHSLFLSGFVLGIQYERSE